MTTYATLADVKSSLGISDYNDDDRIEVALAAAEQMVDAYCGRTFAPAGTAATTRIYAAADDYYVTIDDCTSITLVEADFNTDGVWTAWASTDWQAEPLNGLLAGRSVPYNALRAVGSYAFPDSSEALVRVTATWGWADVPAPVITACRILAARYYKRDDSPMGIAGGPDTGLLYLSRQMDPDVQMLLGPYRTAASSVIGVA